MNTPNTTAYLRPSGKMPSTPKMYSATPAVVPMIEAEQQLPADVARDGVLHERRVVISARAVARRA